MKPSTGLLNEAIARFIKPGGRRCPTVARAIRATAGIPSNSQMGRKLWLSSASKKSAVNEPPGTTTSRGLHFDTDLSLVCDGM